MAVTTIADLPAPVTAAKADWLAGYDWIGFTPASDSPGAASQCAATINRQIGNGYVIEYITRNFGKVNPGFESDPRYLEERAAHAVHAGRLVAVHRLRASYRPLRAILGGEEFERVQDMWAEEGGRRRWSVAFPIVESWEVEGSPLAGEVLGDESMRRVFAHPSGTLRPVEDGERTGSRASGYVPGRPGTPGSPSRTRWRWQRARTCRRAWCGPSTQISPLPPWRA